MDRERLLRHKITNAVQSLALLGGMGLMLAAVGWLLGGVEVMLWAAVTGVLMLLLAPRVSPALILRMYGARRLSTADAPQLHALVHEISRRAGLARVPQLFYVPSRVLNAFAVGEREDAAVAVTDGLLRQLSLHEIAGVLAHEISHVRNNDIRVMGLADLVTRLTGLLSLVGQFLLIITLPLAVLTGEVHVPWLAIGVLILAPMVSSLLQLALSRTRELDADLDAAMLTGDPHGLASALVKLERQSLGFAERVLLPGRRNPVPSVLRSHPHTEERVQRLLELAPPQGRGLPLADEVLRLPNHYGVVLRHPRRHFTGLWH